MALPEKYYVSYSQLQTWRRCKRRWYLGYVARLTKNTPTNALWLGVGVHEALDRYYASNPRDTAVLKEAFEEWAFAQKDEVEKQIKGLAEEAQIKLDLQKNYELGLDILDNYAAFAPSNDAFDVIATEDMFEVPIGAEIKMYDADNGTLGTVPIYYRGRIDGIVRLHSDNRLYLLEQIAGVYYHILRKQKDGPRVKTPLVYRLTVERSRASIRDWPEQVRMMVKDMELVAENGLYYHTPADDCNFCDFFTICSMIQDEADPQDYIDMYFKPKEDDE
jgi:CRISPR/Cas system-associated exonuclease Cas4 (RecB family)